MRARVLWLVGTMMWVACGGGTATPEQVQHASSAGDEQVPAAPAEEVAEAEPEAPSEPEPTGPGFVTYSFNTDGEPVAGTVKVRADTGEVLAEAATGERFELPAGDYRVECQADKAVLVDGPKVWDALVVEPGEEAKQAVAFPWAKVRLVVHVNGKAASGSVTLSRRGAEVVTLPIAAETHSFISPGRYQGKVKTRRSEIEVPEIVIPGESTRNVPINVSF